MTSDDLVERLRAVAEHVYGQVEARLFCEAADEIERLREAVERLRRTVDAGDLAGIAKREAGR